MNQGNAKFSHSRINRTAASSLSPKDEECQLRTVDVRYATNLLLYAVRIASGRGCTYWTRCSVTALYYMDKLRCV